MDDRSFEIDITTLNDLGIFSERDGQGSMYHLFRNTRTLGGRDLLSKIMKEPLTDIASLRNRRSAILYFSEQKPELNVTHNQADMVEHYLKFNKRYLRNNPLDALYDHLSNRVSLGADYYIILTGITTIITFLKVVTEFLEAHEGLQPADLLSRGRALDLVNDTYLQRVIASHKKLTCFQVNKLDNLLRKQKPVEVRQLLAYIYELDVLESVAAIATSKGWSLPDYLESDGEVQIEGLFHPSIRLPVLNNFAANPDKCLVFLTGSNMSGKSSFLKSLGLCVYLAHLGFPVPAKQMSTSVFSGLITTINLPDDIEDNMSHYYSEIKRIKHTAMQLLEGRSLFVIFDELFRGTNPKDASDASLMIIRALCRISNCVFLMSTHHAELAEDLKDTSNVAFKYFESSLNGEHPVFSYRMLDGVSYERSGMHLMRNEGVLEILEQVIAERNPSQ